MATLSIKVFNISRFEESPQYEGVTIQPSGAATLNQYGDQYVPIKLPAFSRLAPDNQKGFEGLFEFLSNLEPTGTNERADPLYDGHQIRPGIIACWEGTDSHQHAVFEGIGVYVDGLRDDAQEAMVAAVDARLQTLSGFENVPGVDRAQARAHLLSEGYANVERQLVAIGNFILYECNRNFGFDPNQSRVFVYENSLRTSDYPA